MQMQTPPRYHRSVAQRYRLEAAKCDKCGKTFFPPRLTCGAFVDACADCGCEFETVRLPDHGKVLTYTVIHVGPSQFKDETPYVNAIIELADGTKIFAMMTDCDHTKVEIGMEVTLEFRKIMSIGNGGILSYGYKAVPKLEYKL